MTRSTRRRFLGQSAVTAGALAAAPAVHAAGDDLLRIGLVGCGGRGTGAAMQALQADQNVRLVALADAFEDSLERSLKTLKGSEFGGKVDVAPERRFTGFDAYKKLIDAVDVVLLATPPHFRPMHLKAAIDAGKHVFAEKPVAVDPRGVRSVLATCEEARKKKLSVVSGLCLRYSRHFNEAMRRIHDGALGKIVSLQANDYRAARRTRARQPGWDDMTYQMRNWYNFTWLSGDFNVEQHVHFLDVCSWANQNKYPVSAIGMGGRQARTGPGSGNMYDHFSIVYEYEDGVRLYSNCRQQVRCSNELSAMVHGSKGHARISDSGRTWIEGENPWAPEGRDINFYEEEHNRLFASIRKGEPLNNGEYMSKSTLLAIMGRMSAYTGKRLTWEQVLNSKLDLTPPKYEWGPLETDPVAIPGTTKFI